MDIDELIGGLDPNNPATVKQLQQALQVKGYDVTPDGKMGTKTSQAIGRYRTDQAAEANRGLETRKLESQAEDRGWQNQVLQSGRFAVPGAIGMGAGALAGKAMEGRQLRTEALQRAGTLPNPAANWSPTRRFLGRMAPFGLYGGLAAGEGYYLRNQVAPNIQSETGREIASGVGTGMMGLGLGITGSGLKAAFQPQALPSPMGANLPTGPGSQPPALPPPDAPPPPPAPRRPSDRLTSAARAAGAGGRLSKDDAADHLMAKGSITDANRTAVAAELGVKSGPNFGKRITDRIKLLKTSRTPLGIIAATGALAYGMGSDEAEAAGASPDEARVQGAKDAATAAGGAGAAMYGVSKLPPLARTLGGAALGAGSMPQAIDAMTDYSPDQIAMARNFAARHLPSWMRAGAIEDAYQMSQVPQRNPLRAPMGAGGDLPTGPGRRGY